LAFVCPGSGIGKRCSQEDDNKAQLLTKYSQVFGNGGYHQ
jgi:hypothetical protein